MISFQYIYMQNDSRNRFILKKNYIILFKKILTDFKKTLVRVL